MIGLLFIVSCSDSFGLVLFTDAVSSPDHYIQPVCFTTARLDCMFLKCVSLICVSEQKDQEEVRRRFASITYSDPLYWDQPGAAGKTKDEPVYPV